MIIQKNQIAPLVRKFPPYYGRFGDLSLPTKCMEYTVNVGS